METTTISKNLKSITIGLLSVLFFTFNLFAGGGGGSGGGCTGTTISCGLNGPYNMPNNTSAQDPTITNCIGGPAFYGNSDVDGDGCEDVDFSVENNSFFCFTAPAGSPSTTYDFVVTPTSTLNVQGAAFPPTTGSCGCSGLNGGGADQHGGNFNQTGNAYTLSLTLSGGQSGTIMVDGYAGDSDGSFTVNVVCPCTPPVMTSANTATICSGATLNIPLTSNPTGATFVWVANSNNNVTGESTTNQTGNTINNTLTNTSSTVQTVTYTVTPTLAGCPGTPQTVTVTVNPAPIVTTPNTAIACSGTTLNIGLTSSPAGATFGWSATSNNQVGGETTTTTNSNTINNTLTATTVQVVNYTVTPTLAGCPGTPYNIAVTVNPAPIVTTPNTAITCSGVPLNIGLTSSPAGATFAWSAANNNQVGGETTGTTNSNTINNTLTATTVQIVNYTVTPSLGGCPGTPYNIAVTVNPTPVVTTPNTAIICSGVPLNIGLTSTPAGATFGWAATNNTSVGGETTGTTNSSTINNTLTATTVQVVNYTVTPTLAGCPGTPYNIAVTVNPAPIVTTPNTAVVCSGVPLNIGLVSSPAGATFGWAAANNNQVGGETTTTTNSSVINNTLTVTSTQVVNYTVTPTLGGCPGTPLNIAVTINPLPTASILPDPAETCAGVALPLNGTPAGGSGVYTTHSWTGAGSGSLSATGVVNPTFTNGTAGTYPLIYTVTDNNGCIGSDNITVTVTANPIATIAPDPAEACAGVALPMNGTPSGGSGVFTTHAWTGAGAGSLNATNVVNPTFTNGTPGTYALTYTVTDNNGCIGTDNITVTVNANPTAVIAPDPAETCAGIALPLNGTPAGGSGVYTTHTWTGAGAGSLNATNIVNPSFTNVTPGTYALTYTVTDDNGCIGTDNISVTVFANPVIALTPTDPLVCNGVNGEIEVTLTSGPTTSGTVNWTGTAAGTSGATTLPYDILGLGAGNYNVTFTDANGCTSASVGTMLNNPDAPVINAMPDYEACNVPFTLLESNITGTDLTLNVGYFSLPNGGGVQYTDGHIFPVGTNNVEVFVYDNNGTCDSEVSFFVTVNENPTATIAPDPAETCEGVALPLNGTPAGGSGVYTTHAWTGDNSILNDATIAAPTVTALSADGVYNLTYTVTDNNGCVGTDNITVTVNASPTATIAPDPAETCAGVALPLNGTPAGGSGVYTTHAWTGVGAGSLSATNVVNPSFTNGTPGSYDLTYTVTDNNGCIGTDNITVTVNANPTATILPDPAETCAGVALPLNGTPAGGSGVYTTHAWTGAGSGSLSATNVVNPSFINGTPGSYDLTFTVTDDNGCIGTDNITVTVNANPTAAIAPDPAETCAGIALPMNGTPAGGSGVYTTHAWSGAGSGSLSATNVVNPSFTNGTPGSYDLTYTVTDDNGCIGTDNIIVTVNANPTATIAPDPAETCAGIALPLNGTPAGGSGVYTTHVWTGAGAGSLNATNIVNPTFTTGTPGTYALTYTVTDDNGCIGTDNISVIVFANPVIALTPTDPLVCNGVNGEIEVTLTSGPSNLGTVDWTGTAAGTSGSVTLPYDILGLAAGNYSITYTDDNGCVSASVGTLLNNPNSPIINAIPDYEACNVPFTLLESDITGTDLTLNVGYFSLPNGGGTQYADGHIFPVGTNNVEVFVYDNNGTCDSEVSFFVTVNANPTATIAPNPAETCEGVALPLNGNPLGGSGVYTSHSWTGDNSILNDATIDAPTVTALTADGVYNLTYTVTDDNGCTGIDNITVTVYMNPSATISPDPAEICAGLPLSMNGNPIDGDGGQPLHSWTGAGAGSLNSTNIVNPTFTNGTPGTYALTYTVTDDNGCIGTDNISVLVNANPVIALAPIDPTVCNGVDGEIEVTLTSGPTTSGTVNWTGTAAGTSGATTLPYDILGLGAGNYNVTFTDANGCISASVGTLLNNPGAPIINAMPDYEACNVTFTLLEANITGTNLTGNQGYFDAPNGGGIQYTDGHIFPVGTNNVEVFVYDNNGSCDAEVSFFVTVNENPTATIAPDPAETCEGVALPLNGTPAGGSGVYTTHVWTGDNSILNDATIAAPTVTALTADGVYNLTYTVTDNNGCVGTDNITVTVTETPVLTLNNPAAVCSPATVDITNVGVSSTTVGAITYFTDPGFTTPVADATAVGAGTYYVVATNGACTDNGSVTVTVTETPVLTLNNPAAVCSPSTVDITNVAVSSTTVGAITYFTDPGFTTPVADATAVGAGTYYVVATNGACTDNGSVTVTVTETPVLTLNNPASVCAPNTVDITNVAVSSTTVGTMTYFTDPGFTTPVADATAVGTGTYYVVATNGACTDNGSVTVTVIDNPVINPLGPIVECANYTLPAITGVNLNAPTYWTGSNQTGTVVTVGTVITQNTTLFMFDGASGCSDEEQLVITINPLPIVTSVTGGGVYCEGEVVSDILVSTTGTGNWTVDYTINGTAQAPVVGSSPLSLGNAPGVYVVTSVTDQNCINTASGSQTITINPIPSAPVAGTDNTYCLTVDKDNMTASASQGGTLTWYTDAGMTSVFATGTSVAPANTEGTTVYYVTETSNGCTGPASTVTITIEGCDITIPTAFTPDGDGMNDTWQILDLDETFPNAVVRVYNRWGNLIFEHESTDSAPYNANAWDGSYQGADLPVASFYYIIEFNDVLETEAATGTVSIIKN